MTENEFKKIIVPLELLGHGEKKEFLRTVLMDNYNNWRKEKQALDLTTISRQSELVCDYCGHKEPDLMGFVLTCNNCVKQKQTGG